MKILAVIIITSIATSVFGQTVKTISIPTYVNYKNEIDTTLWYKWKYDLAKQINLKNLQTSTDTFHFRFWTDKQALDIWTSDHKTYFGLLTNYAQRYDDKLLRKNIYKVGKVYSKQSVLSNSKAKSIFNIIHQLSIDTIPSDDKIKGWKQGFDGVEFLIETSTPSRYDFKTYWTPGIFTDSLPEAKQIQAFVDYLQNDFKIYDYYKALRLPSGRYKINGVEGIEIGNGSPGNIRVITIIDLL